MPHARRQDIAFPTDLELCDKARSWTEKILDHLWEQHGAVTGISATSTSQASRGLLPLLLQQDGFKPSFVT
jgi:hypothetical protein